ncbi:lysoplasmalogenase [Mycolicibacterium vaccae]|uniref:lysoplasmalogenase n=1 Tax=Mycolicibacterium vaccae TaxID=1810 RepID=UPI003CF190D0
MTTGRETPAGAARIRLLWTAAAVVAAGYGLFLIVTTARLGIGADLTGQFAAQPAVKALAAVLLAGAAALHPVARERRWLVAALLFSAAGDYLLAMSWWEPSFVLGLGAFLIAHLCFLAALVPLVVPPAALAAPRLVAPALVVVSCVVLLVWFWPRLAEQGMTVPVTLYMLVLAAMVCAALLADLPTPWTAAGAVCFAVSDAMIGINVFVLENETLAVPIWWVYASSLLLITAGLLFGRASVPSARPAG